MTGIDARRMADLLATIAAMFDDEFQMRPFMFDDTPRDSHTCWRETDMAKRRYINGVKQMRRAAIYAKWMALLINGQVTYTAFQSGISAEIGRLMLNYDELYKKDISHDNRQDELGRDRSRDVR